MSKYNWKEIQNFYDQGHSWDDVCNHFGCSRSIINKRTKDGLLKSRQRIETERIRRSKGLIGLRFVDIETRRKISESQKKAHKDGRAWNIGMSRWNNKPSYPEKFMMSVIQNEFVDKEYIREYSVGIYSIDFAWPHKLFALEIDGDQHQRFDEYIKRDSRKDKFLKSQGWTVLRVPWKEIVNNTKDKINEIKNYIE